MTLLDARSRAPVIWMVAILLLVIAMPVAAEEDRAGASAETARRVPGAWSDEILDLAAHLPIQDLGRVKPLSTWADFLLLRVSGRKTFEYDPDNRKRMSATAWALDCLFFPQQASDYQVILVADSDALVDVGLEEASRRKRDRYSYAEIAPGWNELARKAAAYEKRPAKERTRVESQVLNLARSFNDVGRLLEGMAYGYVPVPAVQGAAESAKAERIPFSKALETFGPMADRYVELMRARKDTPEVRKLDEQITLLGRIASGSRVLAILPPTGSVEAQPDWFTVYDLVDVQRHLLRGGGATDAAHIDAVRRVETLHELRNDSAKFEQELDGLLTMIRDLAVKRGEYEKVETEVFFYRVDPFFWALVLFLLAFVMIAVTWLRDVRWLRVGAVGATILALALLAFGITLRCIIRDRPPVSTLYETVLFITAIAVLVSLITEVINKRHIAMAAAPILGAAGLFLAGRYEALKAEDTMPQLEAVLDTNYWLTLHVLSVTIGYCAGLLASAMGHVYVLGKAFGVRKDAETYRSIARMTYGMVCFGLFFSLVGTILGGVWANDSWGRFWGWDPKENGALMIVIWNVIILHARMGGYIKAFGIAMASIFGGVVVAASWWGVNLLGIGLHTYGFTDGIWNGLRWFGAVEIAVLATGGFWYFWGRGAGAAKA